MVDASKFVKEPIRLSVSVLGIAILGCLSYHVVRWIINKCSKIEKINGLFACIINNSSTASTSQGNLSKDHWWTKITSTKEFGEYKKNWKKFANSEAAREQEAKRLQSSYESSTYNDLANQSPYNTLLGNVYNTPGDFSMWMSGVALIAAYLTEKKKIKGLYVCETLESLSSQIQRIHSDPKDQRCAFVVGTFSSGFINDYQDHFKPNFPQHKVTVCVEKKEGQLTIALVDPEPITENAEISPKNLTNEIWKEYDVWDAFNSQEIVFRAILKACRDSKCEARLLHSQAVREQAYGCVVFALQDAFAYLRDPDFFDKITTCKEKRIKIDNLYEIEVIKTLPAECMVGTQSSKILQAYKKGGGQFDKRLLGRKRGTLQQYLDANNVEVTNKQGHKTNQNHYITKKSFKYLNFVVLASQRFSRSELQQFVNKVLVR